MADMDKAVFDEWVWRILRQWRPEQPDPRTVRDFWNALDDLPAEMLAAGADRLCRYRKKEQGAPTPGDWRAAAIAAWQEKQGKPGDVVMHAGVAASREEARTFMSRVRALARRGR